MQLLTVKEASNLLNMKEKTLYQWVELNQVPHIRLNGSIRFDLEDISAWIKDCKRVPEKRYNSLNQAGSPRKGGS